MLTVLRRVVIVGIVALVGLLLAAFALNARDEPLSAEAISLREPPPNTVPAEKNLYVMLAGLHSPVGSPVISAGLARIAFYNAQVDEAFQDPASVYARLNPVDPAMIEFQGKLEMSVPSDPAFWSAVRAHAAEVRHLLEQNSELLRRYLALGESTGYYETERPSLAANVFSPPTELRRLFLADLALQMQAGDDRQRRAALATLRDDIKVWRRMLTGEGTLISKMLAIANLKIDFLVFSDLIADPDTPVPNDIETFLPASDPGEWDVGSVFATEYRLRVTVLPRLQRQVAHGQSLLDNSDSWIGRNLRNALEGWFFKANATANLDASLTTELAGFAALDPSTFEAQRDGYRAWLARNTDLMSVKSAYNPVGRALVAMGLPAYEQYLLRPYDVFALEKLVRLSLAIRRNQVDPSGIPAFMQQHPEWSTHPADGRPFLWRSSNGELAVQTVAEQSSERRFSIKSWASRPSQGP